MRKPAYQYKKVFPVSKKVKKAVTKIVKTQIARNIEDKQLLIDFARVDPLSFTSGTSYLLSNATSLTQGAGNGQRIGDKIRLKYMDLKIVLGLSTPWLYASMFKILVFRLKSPEGTALNMDDLMVNSAGIGLGRPYRANYKDVMEILYDKVHIIRPVGNISADAQYKYVNIKKKLNIVQTFYPNVGGLGTIAEVRENAIYAILWAYPDTTAAVSRGQCVDLQVAFKYEDA